MCYICYTFRFQDEFSLIYCHKGSPRGGEDNLGSHKRVVITTEPRAVSRFYTRKATGRASTSLLARE